MQILSKHLYMKNYFLILFAFCFFNISAQKQGSLWYFGGTAALDFNSGSPINITGSGMNASEGSSVACDPATGAVLFYSNGEYVWNKNNLLMPNGSNLTGNGSSAQSVVIVPAPCSDSLFYIFTTDANEKGYLNGLQYSVVDMTLNGGNGDVIASQKNIPLIAPTCEKLAASMHANGKDVWVMTIENNSNNFYAYLVTSTGVSAPVISSIGATYSGSSNPRAYLKFSPNGQKLFSIMGWNTGNAQLFDFNNSTGVVSNLLTLDANQYGATFSSNSQLLYTTSSTQVFQYDITSGNAATIIASKQTVGTFAGGLMRCAQLAKNGKIYIANFAGTSLCVIDNPNVIGTGCNFSAATVSLNGKIAMLGLPNFIENYFDTIFSLPPCSMTLSSTPSGCASSCTGTAYAAMIGGTGPFGYSWSSTPVQNTQTATNLCSGTYTVTITDSSTMATSTSIVVVGQVTAPSFTVSPTQLITCVTSSVNVTATAAASAPYTYSWAGNSIVSGANSSTANVNAVGNYTVTVTDTVTGCTKTATVLVNLDNTPPAVSVTPTANFSCITGTTGAITVTSSTAGASYSWSGPGIVSGGSSNIANINTAGVYTVTVTNPINGCTATATVTVSAFSQQPKATGGTSLTLNCNTTSGTITASSTTSGATYSWAGPGVVSGGSTSSATVNAAGTYTVTVTNPANGCTKTATVIVTNNNTPPNISASAITLKCVPNTSTINASSTTSGATFSWTGPGLVSGGTSNAPVVNTAGTYTVVVTNPNNGCTATSTVTVNPAPYPTPTVSADVSIFVGDSTTLTASCGSSYLWTPSLGLSCIYFTTTLAKPTVTTVYCVQVTNTSGCSDTACVTVTVNELCPSFSADTILIANIFTPNDDGKNDLFSYEGWEDCIKTVTTNIYDRWGLLIATTNDINIKWNGKKSNGDKVKDGTYYYLIDVTTKNGEQINFKGFITVVR